MNAQHQNGFYHSESYGDLSLEEVKEQVEAYMDDVREATYKLIIGTDSQPKNGHGVDFITAIVVHRIGAGGIYFWKRHVSEKKYVLRQRMYEEASRSLETATEFFRIFKHNGIAQYEVEIHVDIGRNGPTREMINEVVGMIRGSGFNVKMKPDSYGASKVADRHT